jgi:hypothetical protein
MNEKKKFNERIPQAMAEAHALGRDESCSIDGTNSQFETTFVQTETETGVNDKPMNT